MRMSFPSSPAGRVRPSGEVRPTPQRGITPPFSSLYSRPLAALPSQLLRGRGGVLLSRGPEAPFAMMAWMPVAAHQPAEPIVQVDNPLVRVTEWRFAPGASTGHHRHHYDYVV